MSTPRIANVFTVDPAELIESLAEKLKTYSEINPPLESKYWKTSCAKEFPPEDSELFWFIRSASLLRKLAIKQNLGVRRLRKIYSSNQKKGHNPSHSRPAAGKIIRRCLQQLEKAGLVNTIEGIGRKLTPEGQSLIDKVAHELHRAKSGE
ncbi:30S ribosomal protein S19e [Candidatus Bathyarchaeota archaeon]|nr:30S ribosomal protein S19e [Candidatus Bathyarchaeota archaeon]